MEEGPFTGALGYGIVGSPYNVCMCSAQFFLLHDDFDDSYFLDHDDGDDGGAVAGHLDGGTPAAQAERVQLMNIIC